MKHSDIFFLDTALRSLWWNQGIYALSNALTTSFMYPGVG